MKKIKNFKAFFGGNKELTQKKINESEDSGINIFYAVAELEELYGGCHVAFVPLSEGIPKAEDPDIDSCDFAYMDRSRESLELEDEEDDEDNEEYEIALSDAKQRYFDDYCKSDLYGNVYFILTRKTKLYMSGGPDDVPNEDTFDKCEDIIFWCNLTEIRGGDITDIAEIIIDNAGELTDDLHCMSALPEDIAMKIYDIQGKSQEDKDLLKSIITLKDIGLF